MNEPEPWAGALSILADAPATLGVRGALIVVGGHSRQVGKTAVMLEVLRALSDVPWIAVKVSAHRHWPGAGAAPTVMEEHAPSAGTPTARYLAAGAGRAFLLRAPDAHMPDAARLIDRWRDRGHHVIVESNRLVAYAHPDLTLFVIDPTIDDWKTSSGPCLTRAHALAIAGSDHVPVQALRVGGTHVAQLPVFQLHGPERRSNHLQRWVAEFWQASGRGGASGLGADGQ